MPLGYRGRCKSDLPRHALDAVPEGAEGEAVSDTPKLYARRRPMELEPQYSAHMLAMTVENLRGKSEIAEELAVRDKCIVGLERENAALRAELEGVRKDAERYRHVRNNPAMLLHLSNRDFDAAIDAAIAQKEGK